MGALAAACTLLLGLTVPAAGSWMPASDTDRLCGDLGLCTSSNHTWSTLRSAFDADTACALLARKGVKVLRFYGDSYQRHLYVGLVLTLTGDLPSFC